MRLSLPCALFLLAVSVSRAESPPMTFFEGPSKCALKFEATSEGKAFVSVVVQGERHMLFLDTGATTILDLRIARRLGLNLIESPDVGTGLTGVVGTRWLGRVDLRIGEMKITSFPVSCLDLSALRVLHQKSGLPELDGLIGSDLLVILRAQIDYDSRKLTIKRPTRIP